MFCMRPALLLALVLLVAVPSNGRAGNAAAFGVLNLEPVQTAPEFASAVSEALRRQLSQLSGAAVSAQDMVEVKLVFGCVDEKPSCLARAGRQLGVTRLIYGKLRPHPSDSSRVVVTLHQLDVGDAVVEQSVEETVAARILSEPGPELERITARWLLALASPMKKKTASEPRPITTGKRWNRGLWVSSIVLGALAGGAALTALWTWQGVRDSQDSAAGHLDLLQNRLTADHAIEPYRDFFGSSAQLSQCATVPGLVGDIDYENYRGACQHGNGLATATTGLLVAAGSLAALSVTSLILSRALAKPKPSAATRRTRQNAPQPVPTREIAPPPAPAPAALPTLFVPDPKDVPQEEPPPAGEPAPAAEPPVRLRLESLAPIVSPGGAGVMLQLRF